MQYLCILIHVNSITNKILSKAMYPNWHNLIFFSIIKKYFEYSIITPVLKVQF